jgi:hypothetical protein
MASRAFDWRALENVIEMAFFAGNIEMCAIELEGRKIVVESGFFPIGGVMTGGAILPKLAVMFIIFLVAGKARAGSALEDIVEVTVGTFCFGVFTFQLES